MSPLSIAEHVLQSLPSSAHAWRDNVAQRTGISFDVTAAATAPVRPEAFLIAFSTVTRQLEAAEHPTPWCGWRATWPLSELARAAMLVAASRQMAPDRFSALMADCYRYADPVEKCALLRALPLMDEPQRYLSHATDASRASIPTVFEAVACENPYPAAHFPELNFNQMVLKALLNGVKLERIQDLDNRLNAELTRMARHYADERKGAGKSIPADIGRLLGSIQA